MSSLVTPSNALITALYSDTTVMPGPKDLRTLHYLLDVVSALCKVRGYKTVKKVRRRMLGAYTPPPYTDHHF